MLKIRNYIMLNKLIELYFKKTSALKNKKSKSLLGTYLDKVLRKHGVRLLDTSNGSNLGSGKYTFVVDAIYNGKNVAVKISHDNREISILNIIKNIRKGFPHDIKKHFPIVYTTFVEKSPLYTEDEDEIYNLNEDCEDSEDKRFYYICVVEKLNDTNIHIRDIMNKYNKKLSYINNDEAINKICLSLTNNVPDNLIQAVSYIIENNLDKTKENINKISIEYILNVFNKFDINNKLKNEFAVKLNKFFEKFMNTEFPSDYDENYDEAKLIYDILPETKSLINALECLSNTCGIDYGDLHDKNIMERPATRELVISDFGFFRH